MQLLPEVMQSFTAGRFEDFLEDGASQLQRFFPRRFEGFPDLDVAHDAARNVVGLSYEAACDIGRRSGLLAMRIAFLRTAFGIGILDDPRHSKARQLVLDQIAAAAIKPNTSIGTYLTETKPIWDAPPFERQKEGLPRLLDAMDNRDQDWGVIIEHLERAHAVESTRVTRNKLEAFANAAFSNVTMLGMTSLRTIQLHTLVADGLGLHFFDDPLLPDWGTLYRSSDETAVADALRSALMEGWV
ncbi:hypothetical protein BC777_2905 [Yoonia maricola]|uniref:Uncharacterized protein n=1 Tax=Yoonia maricola TaxID=420999 RepID=A0A2M8W1V1_9RHOB|nr:hypothetical protein [Yoonia maricola]PJI84912.1 hypothetical protein BC777_2905 [Yoonia maricola]